MLRPDDAEYASVQDFVDYKIDCEDYTFTTVDIGVLARRTGILNERVRRLLISEGLNFIPPPKGYVGRGFTANDHNRWDGNPCGGGSGWEQIAGFAGRT